jgi:hypothetical protein
LKSDVVHIANGEAIKIPNVGINSFGFNCPGAAAHEHDGHEKEKPSQVKKISHSFFS